MISARFRALTANSKQIRTELLEQAVKAVQRKHAEAIKKRLQQYPPERPESLYVRTGDLGRGWHVPSTGISGSGIVTLVANSVRYSTYVQGPWQTAIHEGRWLALADAVDREGYHAELRAMMKRLVIK